MHTNLEVGDVNVLNLYGSAALRGMFIYSKSELIDEYVTFLHKSVQDDSLGDIRNHIQQELDEFEITDQQIYDFLKIDVAINIPVNL